MSKDKSPPAPGNELPPGVVWKGNPSLIPFLVPVNDLHEDQSNANTHPERSIASIAASYQDHGQQKPIVSDDNGVIRDGNGQLQAARTRLGWTHLAVLPSNLDGVNLTRYALAVNRTAQHSEWDFEVLAGHLKAIQAKGEDITNLGWADYELAPLLEASWTPPEAGPLPGGDGGGDGDGDGRPDMGEPVLVTKGQREVFARAVFKVRQSESDGSISEGRCLELLSADFLAGP